METLPELPGCCRYCGGESIAHCRHPKSNGGCHLYALCLECGENANGNGFWLKQNGIDMNKVPTKEELLGTNPANQTTLW